MDKSSVVHDISDGNVYQTLLKNDQFLCGSGNTNITAMFNTDGICLYGSSRIELWPIFLTINELSPSSRFARDNMILVGIWQGKGKPPFQSYLKTFTSQMNTLYTDGFNISVDGISHVVKLAIIGGIFDLPAKAGVLNMTLFNGERACITCEEPGYVAKQGKGHSRCYPYRSEEEKHQMRTDATIRNAMENATDKKRILGFRGKTGLYYLASLDLAVGILPDYMHGVLLGVVKTLMHKWFSATNSGKSYFIGKKLNTISQRLKHIKPPMYIERLPRDIEINYTHFKATELQAWLLFYSLPCLSNILPEAYLDHFSKLSEAVYILCGDSILETEFDRAEYLLSKFYEEFAALYGEGSCGLNVHNIGAHLVYFVKQWGPLWAWSCFPYEDANAAILQAVHGTGNVTRQIMNIQAAESAISSTIQPKRGKSWTNIRSAANCVIAGAWSMFKDTINMNSALLDKIGAKDLTCFKKVLRVQKGNEKFYCQEYTRMNKRISYIVLLSSGNIACIKYFVVHLDDMHVYAFVTYFNMLDTNEISDVHGGKHLFPVTITDNTDVISVDEILETIFFIDSNNDNLYVIRVPNMHGRAVFK